MTRDDALSLVAGLMIGSSSRLRSRRAASDRRRELEEQIADLHPELTDLLMNILNEPGDQSRRFREMDWRIAFEDALLCLGRRDPSRFLAHVAPALNELGSRLVLFAVVGELRHMDGLHVLRPSVERASDLTEEEQVELASALWLLGYSGSLLRRMAARVPPENTKAHDEIRDALKWLADHGKLGPPDDEATA